MSVRTRTNRKTGFTLIELMAVVVILAILAGVALPKYFDYQAQAKVASCKGALGGMRAGIANFYANAAINGTAAYPTYTQFGTLGTVMQDIFPENPYQTALTIRDADGTHTSPPPVTGVQGWAYDETAGKVWANSDTTSVDENEM